MPELTGKWVVLVGSDETRGLAAERAVRRACEAAGIGEAVGVVGVLTGWTEQTALLHVKARHPGVRCVGVAPTRRDDLTGRALAADTACDSVVEARIESLHGRAVLPFLRPVADGLAMSVARAAAPDGSAGVVVLSLDGADPHHVREERMAVLARIWSVPTCRVPVAGA